MGKDPLTAALAHHGGQASLNGTRSLPTHRHPLAPTATGGHGRRPRTARDSRECARSPAGDSRPLRPRPRPLLTRSPPPMAAAGTALPLRRPGLRGRHQHAPRHRRLFRPARFTGVTSAAALRGPGEMPGEGGAVRHGRPRRHSRSRSVRKKKKQRFTALARPSGKRSRLNGVERRGLPPPRRYPAERPGGAVPGPADTPLMLLFSCGNWLLHLSPAPYQTENGARTQFMGKAWK
ncbi:translation initiation factor IF-2-like isoform X2 [Rissa tridactyla]|uniref:translation initiation factor IF-2-like isoform X2 n=1 Tax=Rissa tridactyla TaxID=75485 RepID=UPI0023BA4A0F|nr:translation initiation factor IF-2-like isoform X2 [Rissa tridactyla]